MYLVIVDTTQIQPYVFGSNRLRENLGASYLVAQATDAWALAAVPQPNNVEIETGKLNGKQIEKDNLAAEVVYAGGGNIVVIFSDETDAKTFARDLSLKALADAPGLQLVIARKSFDWQTEPIVKVVDDVFDELNVAKHALPASAPLLGLGVTVMCRSTGLPAVTMSHKIQDDPAYPISADIAAKHAVNTDANNHLRKRFEGVLRDSYEFPQDFEQLGRTSGDHSFVAVAHADGDGMGQHIQRIGKRFMEPAPQEDHSQLNRNYITAIRNFSQAVEQSSQAALESALSKLINCINSDGEITGLQNASASNMSALIPPVKLCLDRNGRYLLPFRPIVFGGDDVTFVCDGRLGLSLALEYMQRFAAETTARHEACGGMITASSGIAIVKSHYPFARAYVLAEQLSKSAKKYRREIKETNGDWNDACLDWHFAMSGLAGNIGEIRSREYTPYPPARGQLNMHPVTIEENPENSLRSWVVVRRGVNAFQGNEWAGRRNKVKALREALRRGADYVEEFRIKFNKTESNPDGLLPDIEPSQVDLRLQGWQGGYCGYFDAIELSDWFISLEGCERDESEHSLETHE